MYYNKYIKYKNKYLQLKNQLGGKPFCEKVYSNKEGTCWAVAIQTIFSFGQATSNNIKRVMESFTIPTKNKFIQDTLMIRRSNPLYKDFFEILPDKKLDFLKNIFDKFIDRYYSKILEIRVYKEFNTGHCELIISQNYRNLFDDPIFKYNDNGGLMYDLYFFANLLSIFFLDVKISLINYYDNFESINFNPETDLGIIINLKDHVCSLYMCDGRQKYYNDLNNEVYNCDWTEILSRTSKLYVKLYGNLEIIDYDSYGKKEELKRVESLTLIKKSPTNSELDRDIINFLKYNHLDIKDRTLQYYLACLLEKGIGSIEKNNIEAIKWYLLAANQGHVDAMFKLGQIYWNGKDDIKINQEEGYKWYQLAAEQGCADAYLMIGFIFQDQENFIEAIKYFLLAAEHGQTHAQFMLGNFYRFGVEGIDINLSEAERWYRISAMHANAESQYELGALLYIGNVEQNREAIIWFQEAAKNENEKAQYVLETILNKDNVEKNKEAIKMFQEAINENNEAEYNFGLFLLEDRNSRNKSEAFKWIQKAAEHGNEKAIQWIKQAAEHGNEKAIQWIKEAAEHGK